jgi:hypothetical protein
MLLTSGFLLPRSREATSLSIVNTALTVTPSDVAGQAEVWQIHSRKLTVGSLHLGVHDYVQCPKLVVVHPVHFDTSHGKLRWIVARCLPARWQEACQCLRAAVQTEGSAQWVCRGLP